MDCICIGTSASSSSSAPAPPWKRAAVVRAPTASQEVAESADPGRSARARRTWAVSRGRESSGFGAQALAGAAVDSAAARGDLSGSGRSSWPLFMSTESSPAAGGPRWIPMDPGGFRWIPVDPGGSVRGGAAGLWRHQAATSEQSDCQELIFHVAGYREGAVLRPGDCPEAWRRGGRAVALPGGCWVVGMLAGRRRESMLRCRRGRR